MRDHEWFRERRYAHFDRPIKTVRQAEGLVTDPLKVATHAFLPFISWNSKERRYKKAAGRIEPKLRPIRCAAHADSHIFAYYSWLLSQPYEAAVRVLEIEESVLAYRKFDGGKCNIHFADEVFQRIQRMENCSVITLDVEGFFDNMDHDLLKRAWCALLGVERLPSDHFAVFKAVTRYSHVDRDTLYAEFQIGRRRASNRGFRGPICSPQEFRVRVRKAGLVTTNDADKGIPQGSPISAALSNIYLMSFDVRVHQRVQECGGVYRRYSDDILVLCPHSKRCCEEFIEDELGLVHLKPSPGKTDFSCYERDASGAQTTEDVIQYLGLMYDGKRVLLRHRTVARFQRRMKGAVRSAKRAARASGGGRVFRRGLYERFTHLGNRFPGYAKRAHRLTHDEAIRKQVRKHSKQLRNLLKD